MSFEIDTALPLNKRPMTGIDVVNFKSRHGLDSSDVIYALAIQNSVRFNQMCRLPALPYTTELMIRLYDEYPNNPPWTRITPQNAFEMLYGSVVKEFNGSPAAQDVRRALFRRFTQAIGRSIFTAYRWVQDEGKAKPQMTRIFAKLTTVPNPREALERIARLMYQTRKLDFDALFPLPTLDNPPVPARRGPPSRASIEAGAARQTKLRAAAKSAPTKAPAVKSLAAPAKRPRAAAVE